MTRDTATMAPGHAEASVAAIIAGGRLLGAC
jgi:hypothetical protein